MKKALIAIGILLSAAISLFLYKMDIQSWELLDIEKIRSSASASVMLDKNGQENVILKSASSPIQLSAYEIPDIVKKAFIAAEDARFYEHCGIDFRRIVGALLSDIRNMEFKEGASTITQQLVKLTHLSGEKTIARKTNEMFLALQLEKQLSKDEILTAYLNTVYFGYGAYGIENAARTYFQTSTSELSLAQAAYLAGIIQAPSYYSPEKNLEKSLERKDYVLFQMKENMLIDKEEYQNALDDDLRFKTENLEQSQSLWFRDMVIDEACNVLKITANELLTGGYTLYTSLDPNAQKTIDEEFKNAGNFPGNAVDGTPVQAAFCAMNPVNGEICAIVGGRDYETERGFNRAYQAHRQPGSAFKPISVYAAAVDALGMSPTSILDDTQRYFSGGYLPKNAGGKYYGLVTMRTALAQSLNCASVSLLEFTGVDLAREYAEKAGIVLSDHDNGPSLALGSLTYGVTPAELAAAYAPLANGGNQVIGHTIQKIIDRNENIVYEFQAPVKRVMSSQSAYLITNMLETAVKSGTVKRLSEIASPVAGKTGTVAGDNGNRDIWNVAYTPDWVVCVWMGFDETDREHILPENENGSGKPTVLTAKFLRKHITQKDFSIPIGLNFVNLDRMALEYDHQALLATENTPQQFVTEEVFISGKQPTLYSSVFEKQRTPDKPEGEWLDDGSIRIRIRIDDESVDYLLIKNTGNSDEVCFETHGKTGEIKEYIDRDTDQSPEYQLILRNRRLFENGISLFSDPSDPLIMEKENEWLDIFKRILYVR